MTIEYYKDPWNVTSSLVYPADKGYYYIAQLDEKWVKQRVQWEYGVSDIGNKYAVELPTNVNSKILVYNHDGKYWMISRNPITVKS